MDIPPHLLFIGIFILVPLQYYFSPSNTAHLKYYLNNLIEDIKNYFNISYDKNDKTVIPEMETKADKSDHYGLGDYVRKRSPIVKFRVGDVLNHKTYGYKAVIIGWDEEARAPKEFLMKSNEGNNDWIKSPNYAVLIDVRDRLTPQLGYLSQENIQITTGTVMHPYINKFFDYFDENEQRYIMRPFMKKSYPDD